MFGGGLAGLGQRTSRLRIVRELAPGISPLLNTRFILRSRCLRNFVRDASVVFRDEVVALCHSNAGRAGGGGSRGRRRRGLCSFSASSGLVGWWLGFVTAKNQESAY